MRNSLRTTSIVVALISLSTACSGVTQADVTAAQAAVTSAQASVTAAQTALTSAQNTLESAQAALTKQKNSTISGTLAYQLAKRQITASVYSTKLSVYTNAVTTAQASVTKAQTTLASAQATLTSKTTAYNTILAQYNAQQAAATTTPSTTTATTSSATTTTPATTTSTTPVSTTTQTSSTTATAATTGTTTSTATGASALYKLPKISPYSGAKLPLLIPGTSYTIQQLLNYIRTNNSQANFFVRSGTNQQSVSQNTNLQNIINANLNTTVTIQQDAALITWLVSNKQLTNETKAKYQQILLCFNLNGTTFYLIKPFPGVTFKSAKTTRVPAKDIIGAFDFSKTAVLN